jgi:hypothetical protein
MNSGRTIFLLIMDYPSAYEFRQCVERYSDNYKIKFCNHGYDPQSKLLDIIPRLYGIIWLKNFNALHFRSLSLIISESY